MKKLVVFAFPSLGTVTAEDIADSLKRWNPMPQDGALAIGLSGLLPDYTTLGLLVWLLVLLSAIGFLVSLFKR